MTGSEIAIFWSSPSFLHLGNEILTSERGGVGCTRHSVSSDRQSYHPAAHIHKGGLFIILSSTSIAVGLHVPPFETLEWWYKRTRRAFNLSENDIPDICYLS